LHYNEETNKLQGLKFYLAPKQLPKVVHVSPDQASQHLKKVNEQKLNSKDNTATSKSPAPTPNCIVKEQKEEDKADINAIPLSPPPSLSIIMQTPPIPLLTPPSPPPISVVTQNESVLSIKRNLNNEDATTKEPAAAAAAAVLVNGHSKEAPLLNGNCDLYSQNEDSLSSSASSLSSSSSHSISNDTSTACETENINPLKRKLSENRANEASLEMKKKENDEDSPVASKKLKINEAEENVHAAAAVPNPTTTAATTPTTTTTITNSHPPVAAAAVAVENQVANNTSTVKMFINTGDYMCEWNGCGRMFITSKAVYNHVCKFHLLSCPSIRHQTDGEVCLWTNCDQIKRQKWSLVNHVLVNRKKNSF
jgi:hypothetical protein